ncbi:Smr/MutS family protein [Novosphingobium sp. MW5]|nr:Smr/MutS family protein [Novosphingobium sp. MW5]
MKPPRGLSAEEAALWSRVAATVKPLRPLRKPVAVTPDVQSAPAKVAPAQNAARRKAVSPPVQPAQPPREPQVATRHGLDSTWDRKLAKGVVAPDFTIDLHGHSLDTAWSRLDHGLILAESQGARIVLVVTGRPRPVDRGSPQGQRGVIRAKLLDWLAAGSHASRIAAVRGAHPRHGGAGALYLVLRRPRT